MQNYEFKIGGWLIPVWIIAAIVLGVLGLTGSVSLVWALSPLWIYGAAAVLGFLLVCLKVAIR